MLLPEPETDQQASRRIYQEALKCAGQRCFITTNADGTYFGHPIEIELQLSEPKS